MAQIYPSSLPQSILDNPFRSAEKRAYNALRSLPKNYIVFYGVPWLQRLRDGASEGEADFIIVHPQKGILIVEVKGGEIGYDPQSSEWTSRDRYGDVHRIKDPARQAQRNKYALIDKLKEISEWHSFRQVMIGYSVMFPDVVVFGNVALRLDLPLQIVLDHSALQHPKEAVEKAFDYWQGENQNHVVLGEKGIRIVTNLLARSFQLRTPLGVELAYEEERIVELTEEQMFILDILSEERRAAIRGCAGSGKTMLALEKARRLAEDDKQVLLTCYNYALARYLAERVPKNVTVQHFHGLCKSLAQRAGVSIKRPRDDKLYYNVTLPEAMLDALDKLGPQFDAVVVDEGQDFQKDWWFDLRMLLKNSRKGYFYVFYDDNQNLYGGVDKIPGLVDSPLYLLTKNCRNTQYIHQLVIQFHPNKDRITCRGPKGRPIQWISYVSQQEMLRKIQQKLYQLVREDGVELSDIVILTPRAKERSALKEGLKLGNFIITRRLQLNPPRNTNLVWVTTVHAFKGLERKVVLFAELDSSAGANLETQFYVGCSRAISHLILFHHSQWEKDMILSKSSPK